jgi:hypothetical protein
MAQMVARQRLYWIATALLLPALAALVGGRQAGAQGLASRAVAQAPQGMVEDGRLTLTRDEGYPASAVIDPAGGYAYFGTVTSPGRVVKVRLSDLTRVDALTLSWSESDLTSAVIDLAGGHAYFGANTDPGRVVQVRLSDFTHVGTLELSVGAYSLASAVIDEADGHAYFGSNLWSPGGVSRVNVRYGPTSASVTDVRAISAARDDRWWPVAGLLLAGAAGALAARRWRMSGNSG